MSLTLLFKGCPKVSTNKIYESKHWYYRKSLKDDFRLWFSGMDHKRIPEFKKCVKLDFLFTFRVRPLDSSNCSYMGKMIEDLLVEYGKIGGDTIEFISSVSYQSKKDKKQQSEVMVFLTITETENKIGGTD